MFSKICFIPTIAGISLVLAIIAICELTPPISVIIPEIFFKFIFAVSDVDNSFAKTSEYKWLLKNAENYGFILRYPEDKEDKTKIAYESWHWRYVGEENAKRMNELNMCLEEYVEYLQNGNK